MALAYLPIMAQNAAPKPARVLVMPSTSAWYPIAKAVSESRIALLSSAALRLRHQQPFIPREDLTYRRVPSGTNVGEMIIDHHSGIGRVPKQDPEMVFPRTALTELVRRGSVGSLAPFHFSFMGGVRRPQEIENQLAPAITADLKQAQVDLALLVPY